jgi:glyoxylase-like metal-dependent hydrolase (beta-lactamase superfamily II)
VRTIYTSFVSIYVLVMDGGLFLVDAGWPWSASRILSELRRVRRTDLRLLFITHAHVDHYGSAAELRRLTGVPIAIHSADASTMAQGRTPVGIARGPGRVGRWLLQTAAPLLSPRPAPANVLLEDGDSLQPFGLSATVVHTPGHTPGSSCLWVEDCLAFVGDLLTHDRRPVVQRRYAHDWSQLPVSLARVQSLHPQWVYAGHGPTPIRGETLEALRASFPRIPPTLA